MPRAEAKMLARDEALKKLTYALAHLATTVELLGGARFFDLHVVAEDFYALLLNRAYGWQLKNLNHHDLNAAAVDLGDGPRRLAVQVTSERGKAKVQKTIDKFDKHGLAGTYDTLKVFIIGKRTGDYDGLNVPAKVAFSGKTDVIDHDDLLAHLRTLSTADLVDIGAIVEQEVKPHPWVTAAQGQSDLEALRVYRSYFDRPALQDPWSLEFNFKAFGDALTELISVLNAGTAGPKAVAKKRSDFADAALVDGLAKVYRKLLSLRQLYRTHVSTGEIQPDRNACQFHVAGTEQAFDALKRGVIDEMNLVLKLAGLPLLDGV